MNQNTRNAIVIGTISLVCLSLITLGTYLFFRQRTGSISIATVTECKKIRRAEVCSGFWTHENRIEHGEIENANSDDLQNKIEVLVAEDRTVKPLLRIPLILYLIALGLGFMGAKWWQLEARQGE